MKTEISFTFQTQTGFEEGYEYIKNLVEYAAKETLAYKSWWGLEYIGCKIIAVDLEDANDEVENYYKPRRHWYKQNYVEKNLCMGTEIIVDLQCLNMHCHKKRIMQWSPLYLIDMNF